MDRHHVSALLLGCLFSFGVASPQPSGAQGFVKAEPKLEDIVTFEVRVQTADPFDPRNALKSTAPWKVRRGQIVRLELGGVIKAGWNTYPITLRTPEQSPGQLTKWAIQSPKGVVPLAPIYESQPSTAHEEVIGSYFKYTKQFVWSQDLFIASDAPTGKVEVPMMQQLACEAAGVNPRFI